MLEPTVGDLNLPGVTITSRCSTIPIPAAAWGVFAAKMSAATSSICPCASPAKTLSLLAAASAGSAQLRLICGLPPCQDVPSFAALVRALGCLPLFLLAGEFIFPVRFLFLELAPLRMLEPTVGDLNLPGVTITSRCSTIPIPAAAWGVFAAKMSAATSSICPCASPAKTLSLLAAASAGSAQLRYCRVTFCSSSIIRSLDCT
ncbi:hypothetical protein F2Q69_00017037 [Brassica cretica]|uniref:Uncharacterized protein n=1 Tax=Brassica cretica TaxID=69181 RepID=A0A8S9R996_BRACR|nr:hypothetical protein F2Q69_00017037 [Brassica cretica]